ncbi:hypothetical protein HU723_23950 [Pseudomonas lurida]|jgi:hypothetical protein|uniref:hypothetical protein n=1 Tax=Pseudomonas lurida TaxID=244566 RepID=UPI0016467E9B|nr:hypothetical protein [Pseudomonas lurida]MBC3242239.1 hypothetical protein [Pseudomonas lurida]
MDWISVNADKIIAISAVLVSLISLGLAMRTLSMQKTHNKLSIRPIAHFAKGDYEDCVFVKLKNYGLGPLIITGFDVSKEKSKFKRLIDSFGGVAAAIAWDNFTDDIEGRVLAPQNELTLIQVSFKTGQDDIRRAIRKSLAKTLLTVQYKCIYGDQQPEVQEKLEWFARH